jgi:hypothetical protein
MDHPEVDRFLEEWHRIVRERDTAAIADILADDVAIGAPPYWSKVEGKDVVAHLLGLILETIEDFTYHRQWRQDCELALEFVGHVDGNNLQQDRAAHAGVSRQSVVVDQQRGAQQP